MVWYNYGYGLTSSASNYLYWQVPVYLLTFAVIFIVLAKLLNSAATAVPVAVVVTAATGAYVLMFARNMSAFLVNDVAVFAGFLIAAIVVLKMFMKV